MGQLSLLGRSEEPHKAHDDYERAMERAGRWLALRPRTERELTDRLLEGGFEPRVVAQTITRLRELKLVDDLAFSEQWIEERAARKGLSAAALKTELEDKGVAGEVADRALAASGLDEDVQAKALAAKYLSKVADRPLAEQGARLTQMLARRGYPPDVVEAAVKAVLPSEGWD